MREYEVFGEKVVVEKGYIIVNEDICELGTFSNYKIGKLVPALRLTRMPIEEPRFAVQRCFFPEDNEECEEMWNDSYYHTARAYEENFVLEEGR